MTLVAIPFFAGYGYALYRKLPVFSVRDHKLLELATEENNSVQKQNNVYNGYLSVYRGVMMMLTCFIILAVDFSVFPEKYSKTVLYGTSVMDVGVGSFVFSSGIVGYRFYARQEMRKSLGGNSLLLILKESLKASSVTLLLGLLRFVLTRAVDYDVAVIEYGIHWNFFFTLGFLPIFVNIAVNYIPNQLIFIIFGSISYQIFLTYFNLENYILSEERGNIISANKEGIFSFPGYLYIYLSGLVVGKYIFSSSDSLQSRFLLLKRLFLFWTSTLAYYLVVSHVFNIQIFRRAANLPYMLLIVWFNVMNIWSFFILDYLLYKKLSGNTQNSSVVRALKGQVPTVLDAFNYNGLFIFLVANVLTGIVNLVVRKGLKIHPARNLSNYYSYPILIVYMAALVSISMVLLKKRIKIR
ncbi:hypothetical protein BB559_000863 [Furculomyces boomerangus]|uniref:GPI-anchored wall transfer protein n=2 Tax=Harpellales TaxID=61421 RepID=A0A2T9Z3Y2_9FUNG|nr:hypothetical protein BB559_000863 [Furculomyces boomerangus]PVZ98988.1 hypothetical protein BB558_005001 [Smittium angustum]